MYAVTILILKSLLQSLNQRLQKLKDNAAELDQKDMTEFNHAAFVLTTVEVNKYIPMTLLEIIKIIKRFLAVVFCYFHYILTFF